MVNAVPAEIPHLSIFLVDDSTLVREKLVELLQLIPHVEIYGEAASVSEAIAALSARCPDVLILDLTLPGGSGLDVLRTVKRSTPAPIVLILTMHLFREFGARCLEAGADFYFEKGDFEGVLRVIADLSEGKRLPTALLPVTLATSAELTAGEEEGRT